MNFGRTFRSVFFAICVALSAQETRAEDRPHTAASNAVTADISLSSLQALNATSGEAFVVQDELDPLIEESGGGACPSAAANISMQALRIMHGIGPLKNPHKAALEAFRVLPKLRNGRVDNKLFVELLLHYETQLDGGKLNVTVESAPNSPYATDTNTWGVDGKPDLELLANELKIISYSVSTPEGHFLGRHFVLLKRIVENQLIVVDPTSPNKDKNYRLELGNGNCGRYFLRFPPEVKRNYVNEINTIFTIQLQNDSSAHPAISTAELKAQIDSTAQELKEQGLLRSPRDWRKRTADFGLPALDIPKEDGGLGWNAEQCLEVFRHAGRHDLNLRDVVGGAHSRVLLKSQSQETKALLQGVIRGERYFAITITEPNAGSDFTAMESTSKKVEGGYVLNGTKRFNARLQQATDVIVITKSPEGKKSSLNVFVVPIDATGLEVQTFGAHGLVGNSYGGLTMKDVFVPETALIGDDGQGRTVFREHFLYWRLMQTAAAIGTAERALEIMAERLKTRQAFGGPIGRFTHLQQPMGQHTTELKMAHSLAKEAAKLLDAGKLDEAEPLINGLKAEGVEIALNAVDAATRAFGGEGYSDLVDLGDRLRDLNGLRIADGTTDVMRSSVVSQQFGREFWEMATEGKIKNQDRQSKDDR